MSCALRTWLTVPSRWEPAAVEPVSPRTQDDGAPDAVDESPEREDIGEETEVRRIPRQPQAQRQKQEHETSRTRRVPNAGACTVSQDRSACGRRWKLKMELPEVRVNYSHLGKDRQRTTPLLVAEDRRTQVRVGTAVEGNGRDDYLTKFMTALLLCLG